METPGRNCGLRTKRRLLDSQEGSASRHFDMRQKTQGGAPKGFRRSFDVMPRSAKLQSNRIKAQDYRQAEIVPSSKKIKQNSIRKLASDRIPNVDVL